MLQCPVIIFDTAKAFRCQLSTVWAAQSAKTAMTEERTMEAWYVSPEERIMPWRYPAITTGTMSSAAYKNIHHTPSSGQQKTAAFSEARL